MNFWTDAVFIDFARNTIQLRVPGISAEAAIVGLLDVGANGRLLGVEIGEQYIHVMESAIDEETYVRSAEVELSISADVPALITIPRRGSGYEITYPSGNQCWQMKTVNGKLIQVCAAIVD